MATPIKTVADAVIEITAPYAQPFHWTTDNKAGTFPADFGTFQAVAYVSGPGGGHTFVRARFTTW